MTDDVSSATMLKRLQAELDATSSNPCADLDTPDPVPGGDSASKVAVEQTNTAVQQALGRHMEAMNTRIDAAIRRWNRLGDGAELCDGCGEPIGAERLEAVPWAEFCFKCETANNKKPKHRRRQ